MSVKDSKKKDFDLDSIIIEAPVYLDELDHEDNVVSDTDRKGPYGLDLIGHWLKCSLRKLGIKPKFESVAVQCEKEPIDLDDPVNLKACKPKFIYEEQLFEYEGTLLAFIQEKKSPPPCPRPLEITDEDINALITSIPS